MKGHESKWCGSNGCTRPECVEAFRAWMREYRQRPEVKARNAERARANRYKWHSYRFRSGR